MNSQAKNSKPNRGATEFFHIHPDILAGGAAPRLLQQQNPTTEELPTSDAAAAATQDKQGHDPDPGQG